MKSKLIRFPNGLRLVIAPNTAVRSVAVGIFVGAGVIVEKPEENGISHFIEHMLFKGTKTRSAFDIVREMDAVGASVNAATGKEYTKYYFSSLDTNAEKCLSILSDMYFNSVFDPVELERERKVIFEEIDECEDDPYDVCDEHATSEFLKGSPFEMTVLGTKESLAKLTSEDLKRYHDEKYVASNTLISIAGNMTEERAVELVDKYFTPYFSGKTFSIPTPKSAERHSTFVSVNKEIEQAHVMLTFPSIDYDDPRRPMMSVISCIFSSEMSSRLFQSVREKLGLCYTIDGYSTSYPNKNSFYTIYTSTNKQSVKKAVEAIKKEVDLLIKDGVTDAELSLAKEKIKTALVLGQENTRSIMNVFGIRAFILDELFDIDERLEGINAVTKEDVLELAREIFDTKYVCATLVSNGVDVNVLDAYLNA